MTATTVTGDIAPPIFVDLQGFVVNERFVTEMTILANGRDLTHHGVFRAPMSWNLLTKSEKSQACWLTLNHHEFHWTDGHFEKEVEIRFVNIRRRHWIRQTRLKQRRFLNSLWCDRSSYRKSEKCSPDIYADIFRLRRLFGVEPLVSDHTFKTEDFCDDDSPVEIWYDDVSSIEETSSVRTDDSGF
ncbi:hypothetical protein EAG_15416 [Camponotus floridanus]|uniref:Uncharacterized protein n=1 Tax=Camponotus floridanus TaxID=104421 RepID=E2A3D9_CAMFO|nr:hypothetical protein EAG_15416 [Camponotus floridanus]